MINFKELTFFHLLKIKNAHEKYFKENCWDTYKCEYHFNVICSVNDELFRRYNSVWSK